MILEVRLEGEGVHRAREEGRAFQVVKKEQAKALWLDGACQVFETDRRAVWLARTQ